MHGVSAAKHVTLPWPFELEHQPAGQRVKLIVSHVFVWKLHVLLVEQEKRAMQLVPCRIIYPARALPVCGAVLGIRYSRQSSRICHDTRFKSWIAYQKLI